ncbi:PREDICTED: uncharacterized protein LOC106815306 isoform X2 [Priapulus caudatus]|uniref:Uncharacterized protein LOC106815306 isoform X2 n=1 Tax=Priapulus caudatus TaxID=37621 RepID=A0ABM1ESR7_PRICU|nr:PREDICTED: uncharacterized protein LOC106815306 isoform X2 [Priapulus caudatus]
MCSGRENFGQRLASVFVFHTLLVAVRSEFYEVTRRSTLEPTSNSHDEEDSYTVNYEWLQNHIEHDAAGGKEMRWDIMFAEEGSGSATEMPEDCQQNPRICEVEKNERCVSVEEQWSCQCVPGYYRNPVFGGCPGLADYYKVTIRFSDKKFTESLNDPTSAEYRALEHSAIATMWELSYIDSTLRTSVKEIDVLRFERGSVLTVYNLVTDNSANITNSDVEYALSSALVNAPTNTTLNLVNATLTEVVSVSRCEDAQLNYCHSNATCTEHTDGSGFTCACAAGLVDCAKVVGGSCFDWYKPGEQCLPSAGTTDVPATTHASTTQCAVDFCAHRGTCRHDKLHQKTCECDIWYGGNRCEIDIAGLIAANIY